MEWILAKPILSAYPTTIVCVLINCLVCLVTYLFLFYRVLIKKRFHTLIGYFLNILLLIINLYLANFYYQHYQMNKPNYFIFILFTSLFAYNFFKGRLVNAFVLVFCSTVLFMACVTFFNLTVLLSFVAIILLSLFYLTHTKKNY